MNNAPIRILVHDYAGHPFQIQLSRKLAARGHEVLHVYSGSTHTPRGPLDPRPDDPSGLRIQAIHLEEQVSKYSFVKRRSQELTYGKLLARTVGDWLPDVVLSANTPLDAQARLQKACARIGARFVFWMQDAFGEGVTRVLQRRLPMIGAPVAWYYRTLERRLLRRSGRIVLITEDFKAALPREAHARSVEVPNWAPLDSLHVLPKDNPWARDRRLTDTLNFVYSGTLGLKHNPDLLVQLAIALRAAPSARVIVVSEGSGAAWLHKKREALGLDNLLLFDFQPFELLPEVLATGDVLLALLEADAGAYAVPSKVLSYLCAGRALLAAIPESNLAARTLRHARAGILVAPGDGSGFAAAGLELAGSAEARETYGRNARRYAEGAFDIEAIADRFEDVLLDGAPRAVAGRKTRRE